MQFVVEPEHANERLDGFLATKLVDVSRSRIQRAIEAGQAIVNGISRSKVSHRVQPGDEVSLQLLERATDEFHLIAEDIPLEIIYEDDALMVVNKPRGMVTHPAVGSRSGTLVNALLGYSTSLSKVGGSFRPGILHRLDKETSGLLLVAKTDDAHTKLAKALEKHYVDRKYLALVWGAPRWEKVRVDAPIGRSESDRKKMAIITEEGKSRDAITDFTVLERFKGFALLEAKLHTGRTHQVRVHAAFAHHPVVGDTAYGGIRRIPPEIYTKTQRTQIEQAIDTLSGQALHAYKLEFRHPTTEEQLSLETPPPPPIADLLDLLRKQS